ncbi:MAG: hypothetical protein AAGA54_33140 [Myxococcota bacterium]
MDVERWSVAAGFVPPLWAILLVAVGATLATIEGIRSFRAPPSGTSRGLAAGLLAMRLLAIAAVVGIAFELTLRIEQVSPLGRRVVVLVDRSASMSLADAAEDADPATRQSRLETLWNDSAASRAAWAEQGLLVDVRGFDLTTQPLSGDAAQTLAGTPSGAGSDLAAALSELGEADPTQRVPLVGVVVLSDGLVAPDRASDQHVQSVARSLGVPVTTASVGAPQITDVSVADVRAGEFAFVENVTEIDATIIAHGLRDQTTTVQLRRNGEVVYERPLILHADGVPHDVRFEVAPDRIGQFVYEVVVEPLEGEATTENNRRAFVQKVLRDKVRVLHVAGRPDWDVRALRVLLRRDPNVELLSYYILRGFDDITREDTTAPLSLIPFPTDELFEEQLGSFDLVVLHNFDAVQHQVGGYVDNIAEYVLDGGALVLIGGDLGLSDGGYAPRSIASVLPVDTRAPADNQEGPYRPAVSDAGRRHPITAWLGADESGWDALPELDTFNAMPLAPWASRIGASVLLEHPTARNRDGSSAPLLAVAEPGQGRVMVLSTGSTWRMGFAPRLPLIDGARPYDLLWLGAVRWLLRDDSSGRLSLESDKPRYRVGETTTLQARALSTSYAPEPDVEVPWRLMSLDDDGPDATPLASGVWSTDGQGRAETVLDPLPVGAYAAYASRILGDAAPTDDDAAAAQEVRRVFIVDPPGRELAKVDADPGIERLQRLAERTDGAFVDAADGSTLPKDLPVADPDDLGPEAEQVDGRRDIALWNGWASALLLLLAFGGEWILRRRIGLA